jgi:hypothetical protein
MTLRTFLALSDSAFSTNCCKDPVLIFGDSVGAND